MRRLIEFFQRRWHRMKIEEFTRLHLLAQTPMLRIALCTQLLEYLGPDALQRYQPSLGVTMPLVTPHAHMNETIEVVNLWLLCLEREQRIRPTPLAQTQTHLEAYLVTSENNYASPLTQFQEFYHANEELLQFMSSFAGPDVSATDAYHLRILTPYLGALYTTLHTLVQHKLVL